MTSEITTAAFDNRPSGDIRWHHGSRDQWTEWLELGFLGKASFRLIEGPTPDNGWNADWQCVDVPTFEEAWGASGDFSGDNNTMRLTAESINAEITHCECPSIEGAFPKFVERWHASSDSWRLVFFGCPVCHAPFSEQIKREALSAIGKARRDRIVQAATV